jgi:methyl-accepting chemotaxis protein
MDEVVQQNAALVEQAAAASGSLQDQAARLREAVKVFKLKDNTIVDIRDEPRAMQSRREPQQLESARASQAAAPGAPRTLSAPASPAGKAAEDRSAGQQGTSPAQSKGAYATKPDGTRSAPERKHVVPATTADDDDWTEF